MRSTRTEVTIFCIERKEPPALLADSKTKPEVEERLLFVGV